MAEHPVAAFVDQIKPGMRVDHARRSELWSEPVLITQVRRVDETILGEAVSTIHLLGIYDDGRPFSYTAGPQMAVHIHGVTNDVLRGLQA